jgi:hypothetical protein
MCVCVRACVRMEGGVGERFFQLRNISYSAILFTDKRTWGKCIRNEYIQKIKHEQCT